LIACFFEIIRDRQEDSPQIFISSCLELTRAIYNMSMTIVQIDYTIWLLSLDLINFPGVLEIITINMSQQPPNKVQKTLKSFAFSYTESTSSQW
jgi:hypothetical protein